MILAVVDDLFFAAKIGDTGKSLGLAITFVTTPEALFETIEQEKPTLIIFDLNAAPFDATAAISKLKRDPDSRRFTIIGYHSHVQVDLKESAMQAGCDMVLPKSAFSKNLPELLREYGK